jgi:FKBP-type peptidyl-prolyl cis-trans isomerase
MKTTVWIVIASLGTAVLLSGCKTSSAPTTTGGATNAVAGTVTNAASSKNNDILTNEQARASYAIGMMLGHNWQQQGLDADPEMVVRGIKDVQSDRPTLLSQQEMRDTLNALQRELFAKQQKKREELAAKNKAEGEAFLATNKSNPGVVTLPDGLQYKIITNGTGAMPTNTDIVTVNYRGTLLDGTEFDSSFKRGQPAKFPIKGVIPGWTEALLKMKVGSRWQLFVPPELAYGVQGRPGIPPNSVLIFDVDLLSTESPPPPPPAASNNQPLTSDIIKVPSAEELKKGAQIEVIKKEDVEKLQKQQSP